MITRATDSPSPAPSAHAVALAPVLTLVLWTSCLLCGVLGFALPYARPRPPAPQPPPVTAEKIVVQLTRAQPHVVSPAAAAAASLPAPTPPPLAPSPVVATLTPELAFPSPVSVSPPVSADARTSSGATPAPTQSLVLGQGEGRQPSPVYPPAAIRLRQEGAVTLRLTVARDGRVTDVEIASPSPWPLLNAAAVAAVRERWHFSPGAERVYDVSFPFILKK